MIELLLTFMQIVNAWPGVVPLFRWMPWNGPTTAPLLPGLPTLLPVTVASMLPVLEATPALPASTSMPLELTFRTLLLVIAIDVAPAVPGTLRKIPRPSVAPELAGPATHAAFVSVPTHPMSLLSTVPV